MVSPTRPRAEVEIQDLAEKSRFLSRGKTSPGGWMWAGLEASGLLTVLWGSGAPGRTLLLGRGAVCTSVSGSGDPETQTLGDQAFAAG